MDELINIAKALSDDNRVRALMMLRNGELCVCQLIEMLGLAPSTVSKHMSILRQARLVTTRKQGRWNYYRLPDKDVPEYAIDAIKWLQKFLDTNKKIIADNKQLRLVCKIDMDQLCACYKKPNNTKSDIKTEHRRRVQKAK